MHDKHIEQFFQHYNKRIIVHEEISQNEFNLRFIMNLRRCLINSRHQNPTVNYNRNFPETSDNDLSDLGLLVDSSLGSINNLLNLMTKSIHYYNFASTVINDFVQRVILRRSVPKWYFKIHVFFSILFFPDV